MAASSVLPDARIRRRLAGHVRRGERGAGAHRGRRGRKRRSRDAARARDRCVDAPPAGPRRGGDAHPAGPPACPSGAPHAGGSPRLRAVWEEIPLDHYTRPADDGARLTTAPGVGARGTARVGGASAVARESARTDGAVVRTSAWASISIVAAGLAGIPVVDAMAVRGVIGPAFGLVLGALTGSMLSWFAGAALFGGLAAACNVTRRRATILATLPSVRGLRRRGRRRQSPPRRRRSS